MPLVENCDCARTHVGHVGRVAKSAEARPGVAVTDVRRGCVSPGGDLTRTHGDTWEPSTSLTISAVILLFMCVLSSSFSYPRVSFDPTIAYQIRSQAAARRIVRAEEAALTQC